jgi:hypothetical protein
MYGSDDRNGDPSRTTGPASGGLGSSPSGPEFVAPRRVSSDETSATPAPSRITAAGYAPQRRSAANLVTVAVIAIVALVVGLATALAHYGDTHIAAPAPVRLPSVHPEAPSPTQIEFTTPHGTGKLVLLSRTWEDVGRQRPAHSYLEVQVRIICTSGRVGYDPYNFQAFDEAGELFDVDEAGLTEPVLEVGELSAGQSVSGAVAFDIPRGEVTLLMTDESEQSITALKIPD